MTGGRPGPRWVVVRHNHSRTGDGCFPLRTVRFEHSGPLSRDVSTGEQRRVTFASPLPGRRSPGYGYTGAVTDDIDVVRGWIDASVRLVALTGAGISTESGVPDFRGPYAWTRNPTAEKLSNIHFYMSDPEVRRLAWKERVNHPAWHAEPNSGHRALVDLERRGKLHALVTQNIDGLHQRAGNSDERVIEVHGTLHEVMCMNCGWRGPMRPVLDRVRAGETTRGVGLLKRRMGRAVR